MRELELIEEIKKRCEEIFAANFDLSIGDDCAIRKFINSGNLLLSADICVEDVHFSRSYMSFFEIGYKSAVSNISDIAAMGGIPDFLIVTLAFPNTVSSDEILSLYDGIIAAAREYGVPVVGGDLSKSDKIIVSISVGGISQKRALKRSGAKPQDGIWVSGSPGMSGRGLSLLQKHGRKIAVQIDEKAVLAHVRPKAQVSLGNYLQANDLVTSCIDISDGVSKEILAITKASGVGAMIFSHPEHDNFFFDGGEDYELLFTADKSFSPALEGVKLSKIGEITAIENSSEDNVFLLENKQKIPLKFSGFAHF